MRTFRSYCVILLLLASTGAFADPALWVARSRGATIYLFGTIHVLPDEVKWHYPMLDCALAASHSLYVEEDDGSRAKIRALILKYGTSDSDRAARANIFDGKGVYPHADYVWKWHKLSHALGPADGQRLRIAAERSGLPLGVDTLDSMRPWLAALTLSVAATSKSGYEPQFGVDAALERAFTAQGKPVRSFETTHDQIAFFAEIPPDLQIDLLRNVLESHTMVSTEVATLVRDWLAGDVPAIAAAVDGGIRENEPELYDVLLVNRNRKWARQIERLLKQRDTTFVAVGAGHLAGPDSIQVQLAKLGIETERVH